MAAAMAWRLNGAGVSEISASIANGENNVV
jgi:hypothetical protein